MRQKKNWSINKLEQTIMNPDFTEANASPVFSLSPCCALDSSCINQIKEWVHQRPIIHSQHRTDGSKVCISNNLTSHNATNRFVKLSCKGCKNHLIWHRKHVTSYLEKEVEMLRKSKLSSSSNCDEDAWVINKVNLSIYKLNTWSNKIMTKTSCLTRSRQEK